MLKKSLTVSFLLLFVLSSILFSADSNKLLIAVQNSKFKDAVVEKIQISIQEAGVTVELIKLKQLKKVSVDDYNAILLVNTCKMWKVNGKVRKFIKSLDEEQRVKVLMFVTAGDEKWKAKKQEVDTITSASVDKDIDKVTENLVEKLREKMNLEEKLQETTDTTTRATKKKSSKKL